MNGIAGIILAGGRASRMGGGDKCLRPLAGRPLLRHVIDRIQPRTDMLAISANGEAGRFAGFALPVLADTIPGFVGPLAGVLAGMEWAADNNRAGRLVSVAGDTPLFPADLVSRLKEAAHDEATIVVAASGGRRHPVFALWPVALAPALRAFLTEGATYKASAFVERHKMAVVNFPMIEPDGKAVDPFFNINTEEDLVLAQSMITEP